MHDYTTNIHTIENMAGLSPYVGVKGKSPSHMVSTRVPSYLYHGFYTVPKVINRLIDIIGLQD
jgi:hypothetical protein